MIPDLPEPLPARADGGLRIRGLTKQYRPSTPPANDAVDLDVAPGEVCGFLGPNGAGKTTLVRQIVGLLAPSAGTIHLDGVDLVAEPDLARQMCSFLPQGTLPIDALTLREAIELVGRIRGGDRRRVLERADELLAALELEEWRDSKGMELSGGVRRLCGFVMAAVWPGRLLILDEPTNDVDPLRRRLLWRQIRRLGDRGTSVLLVTHNVLEAEQSVDRLAVIDRGRVLATGTPGALKAPTRGRLRLELHLPAAVGATGHASSDVEAPASLDLPDFVLREARFGHRQHLWVDQDDGSRAIEWAQAQLRDERVEEYSLTGASLEDVYLQLIGRADALEDEA
ncbi:MAG: ABC transporter ATP-binding protein [Acidobacteria bacterium]|nr:MAG: ABC transporter ATP-binding protein [Acidobacteriota bacterium]REK10636.1 MAG: ABC transporter ATP-binding protein [Acidobacteriota bacterium]